jgi:WD40 repeat protein
VSRVFMSHSSRDSRQAIAVKKWLIEQEPGLTEEIFLDQDPHTGIRPGERWRQALQQANARCEAVICLLSKNWEASRECQTEFRYAENLNKTILCARLEPVSDTNITSEWQRCDLFPDHGPTDIEIADGGGPVVLDAVGLQRLLDALRALGIGAEHFPWPPPGDADRAPYRGWAPLEEVDAAVFFGRDAQILGGLDALHGMRTSGVKSLFVILGPSGAGKSSFLRAGLLPRLRRDDRRFLPLPIVRPERAVLTGDRGLAHAIHELRTGLGLAEPMLGVIKNACHPEQVERVRAWLEEARQTARDRLLDVPADQPAPTLVLPVDQAEELFNADAGPEAPRFLELLAALVQHEAGVTPAMIVALTIRADRYEPLQTAAQLDPVHLLVFPDLKPMLLAGYAEVITGPARRASAAGRRLLVEPALVERLLAETAEGADALPLLALTLERLYRDFGADGDLTLAEYESMGGMAQIVQTEVDQLLAADAEQRQADLDTLHDAFIPWLATISPDSDQPMRRLARWDDLPAASYPLIQQMVEKRLLVKDTRDGQTVVEVALESLLRQWRELAAWLRDEAQDLKDADTLERAAADWRTSDRNESWLLEGTRLVEAETLAAKPGFRDRLDPTRDYLHASRRREDDRIEAEKQRQQAELQAAKKHAAAVRKRSRILIAVLAITVVIATVAVVFFVRANSATKRADERTREALALKLTAQGQAMLAGSQGGGDVRALQQILAGQQVMSTDTGALFTAVVQRLDTLKIIESTGPVISVALSPDGRRIVSGSDDNTLRVWDADSGQLIGALAGHTDKVTSVAFSPDGHLIVSGGWDNSVRLWDARTGQPIGAPLTGHTDKVVSVAFSPDGRRIVSGSADGTLRLWDAATRKLIGAIRVPIGGTVAFSPDGRRIVSGSDKTLMLWDASTGQQIGVLTGHTDAVTTVAFSPDGHRIASGSYDKTVRLWDAESGQPIGGPLTGHTNVVTSVRFSPDGNRMVSGSYDNTLRLWNPDTGQPVGEFTGHQGRVLDVAFSPDGHLIVSGSSDNTLRLWDADTGPPMAGDTGVVTSAAFSPDGHRIVSSGTDGTLQIWNADTRQRIGDSVKGPTNSTSSVAFTPDGQRIVCGGQDGTVRLWDIEKRLPIGASMNGEPGVAVTSVAVSPDGRLVVSGNADGTVRLWYADTGKGIGAPMTGHTAVVTNVAFSPDGHSVLSTSLDQTVRLWSADTVRPIAVPMKSHPSMVASAVFSPDGQRIVAKNWHATRRLWPAPGLPDWPGLVCAKLGQNMSHKQWREWVSPNIDYIKVCPDLPVAPD